MAHREYKGVIFDMDGVLILSADAHYESWRRLGDECGTTITRLQFRQTFGRHNDDIIPQFFGTESPDRARLLANRKEELYREIIRHRPPLAPGAEQLIRQLHEKGFLLAVGSSGPRENIDLALAALNASSLMDVRVTAEDVSRGKPDPQVFQLAAARLGLAPNHCVVIEDAPVGIQAARAAGARAIAIHSTHERNAFDSLKESERPHRSVDRLCEITVEAIEKILAE